MHPDSRLFLNAPLLFEWTPLFAHSRFIDSAFCKLDSQDQRSKSTLRHVEISGFFFSYSLYPVVGMTVNSFYLVLSSGHVSCVIRLPHVRQTCCMLTYREVCVFEETHVGSLRPQ